MGSLALTVESIARLKSIMEKAGLKVYETTRIQLTLAGARVPVHVVVATTEAGDAKIQVSLYEGVSRMLVIYHGNNPNDVARLADRLVSLGGRVDVDGERLTASFKNPDVSVVSRVALALGEAKNALMD